MIDSAPSRLVRALLDNLALVNLALANLSFGQSSFYSASFALKQHRDNDAR